MMRVGHRQGGGVGGCSSGIVREITIIGWEFSECGRTHTLFGYPLGKSLEAILLNEPLRALPFLDSTLNSTATCSVAMLVL